MIVAFCRLRSDNKGEWVWCVGGSEGFGAREFGRGFASLSCHCALLSAVSKGCVKVERWFFVCGVVWLGLALAWLGLAWLG